MKEPKDCDDLGFWIFLSVVIICATLLEVV